MSDKRAMAVLVPLDPPLNIVLVEPRIPPNTGNVARLCACIGARLHLVGPLGFSIGDAELKRAGLDYWTHVFERLYPDLGAFLAEHGEKRLHLFSARATRPHTAATYAPGDFLLFGSETEGLPASLMEARPQSLCGLPMLAERRSLNLATSVGIAAYEALRQVTQNFGAEQRGG